MKIIISPAKSLNYSTPCPVKNFTQPIFLEEAQDVNTHLKELSPKELGSLMGISEKLSELNWQRNQDFKLPFTLENARQAIYTFDGDVYTGLDVFTLPEKRIQALQSQLRILSGLYGLLKPLDLIQAYRLEMGTKFSINSHSNLYSFWKKKITQVINEELKEDDCLVNLASTEYSKAVDLKNVNVKLVTPQFKDFKNGKLKTISFFAKKARGLMVRYIIEEGLTTPEELINFTSDGYAFSEEYTEKTDSPVFIR